MMNLPKLKRLSLPEEVATRIQERISLGSWKGGDKLPTEPELMKYFEVSRSTIREAVKLLANSGWVRVQQGLGTFVEERQPGAEPLSQRLKRVDTTHLDEVRIFLEEKIVGKAVENRTPAQLLQMRAFLDERKKYAEEEQAVACIEVDIAFHTTIARASGNPILAELYEAMASRLKASFLQRYKTAESFRTTQLLHEQLFECLESRDMTGALETIREIARH